MVSHLILFFSVFIGMEVAAWALHKYVMHGFLWNLHADHHTPPKDSFWQKNDWFAVFFAVPSMLTIFYGSQMGGSFYWATFGYSVMVYGAAYFFVHEVLIHRRLKFWDVSDHWYVKGVVHAHRHHHQVSTKGGAINFGMLWVPLRYFKKGKVSARLR